jgi:hypothetical protein
MILLHPPAHETAFFALPDEQLIRQNKVTKLVKRVPEEELMDVPLHAQAYASADFSEPNSKLVALFSEKFPAFSGQHIMDLGCGPAISQ